MDRRVWPALMQALLQLGRDGRLPPICKNFHIALDLSNYLNKSFPPMRIINYSEARNSLKAVLDSVVEDADVAVITRRDAADAVVMSLDHYRSIVETLHLVSTPANATHLAKSIAQFKAGKAKRRSLAPA